MYNLVDIYVGCINAHYFFCLLGTMPLQKNQLLPLRTIALRYIVKNLELFWKEEWDPELQEVTEASDDILLKIRKDYLK